MIVQDLSIEKTIAKVYKYCVNMTNSHWRAEDLTQETIFKAWKYQQDNIKRPLTISFLYTIARNLYIDEFRKDREIKLNQEDLTVIHNDFLEWDELLSLLCSTLPIRKAMLIALKDIFKYTSQEIACMLRVSEQSIKTALHRARKELISTDLLNIKVENSYSEGTILDGFIYAVKNQKPNDIFYFYRLLETTNYSIICSFQSGQRSLYITDPDGNVLEVVC